MKILDIKVMRGPNYWSIRRHKLVQMRLDLEELEQLPTNKIEGFGGRLAALFPTMFSHRCSIGAPGGFFHRVEEGTWMGHVIEHIALELQTLAGMECGFGRTRGTGKEGVYNVVFSYMEEKAGIYTAKASVRIAEALIAGNEYDLAEDIQNLREIREEDRLGPSTGCIVDEAISRGIPYIRLNRHSLVQLGYGINQKRIRATIASTTSSIAVDIACDKEETKNLLEAAEIPVPRGRIVYSVDGLKEALERVSYPIVTKPIDGNHGKGATTNINSLEDAIKGFEAAQQYSRGVIVEKFITGQDHRVLVINYKYVAAAIRKPAAVKGDGFSTIQQLINITNEDPRRGYGHEKTLTQIKIDQFTLDMLDKANLTLESVLPKDEELFLKPTANLSTGGTATDVTDMVHPDNIFMCERISRIIGLDICGIDIMAEDLTEPIRLNGGAILEVNAAPGFRMHIDPAEGIPRNVAEPVIDMLYPPGSTARIPIIAVTGTNGKTTTTRLMAHMVKTMGLKVGYTTTDGIYIQNRLMMRGDCTGPVSAEFVLKDPSIDFAILECARGGILRAGLGFHNCDIAIVTNLAEDHLGLQDIDTMEQLTRVKSVVPASVLPSGYSILNADNKWAVSMAKDLKCNVAYFSLDENNPVIKEHIKKGGLAAIHENGYVTICKGTWKIRVEKSINIPLTYGDRATYNIGNILPALLAGFIRNYKVEDMRLALQTFIPGPIQTPGRMNIFRFKNFELMVDYAHNTAGFEAIGEMLSKIDAKHVGVIAGVGDRRDEDTIALGRQAAKMFSEIVIRQDKNLRGKTEDEIIELIARGVREVDPNKKITVFKKESDAIDFAVKNARKGTFLTICSDVVPDALDQILALKEAEDKGEIELGL